MTTTSSNTRLAAERTATAAVRWEGAPTSVTVTFRMTQTTRATEAMVMVAAATAAGTATRTAATVSVMRRMGTPAMTTAKMTLVVPASTAVKGEALQRHPWRRGRQ